MDPRSAAILMALAACGGGPKRRCDDPVSSLRIEAEAVAWTHASYQQALARAGITLIDAETKLSPGPPRDAGVPFSLDGEQVVVRFPLSAPDQRQLGRLADGRLVLVEPVRRVVGHRGFVLCGCPPGASGGGGAHVPPGPDGQEVYVLPVGAAWAGTRRVEYQAREDSAVYDQVQPDGRHCPRPD